LLSRTSRSVSWAVAAYTAAFAGAAAMLAAGADLNGSPG
jgi:hypothetical protein